MTIYIELIGDKPKRTTPFKNVAVANYSEYTTTEFDDYTSDNKKYIFQDNEVLISPDYEEKQLINARELKLQENIKLAKNAIENGSVEYKGALIETNSQTVGDLTATEKLLKSLGVSSFTWLSKDDKEIELNINDETNDFLTLGCLILEFKQNLWRTTYLNFKNLIENATTLEEINSIEIIY